MDDLSFVMTGVVVFLVIGALSWYMAGSAWRQAQARNRDRSSGRTVSDTGTMDVPVDDAERTNS